MSGKLIKENYKNKMKKERKFFLLRAEDPDLVF